MDQVFVSRQSELDKLDSLLGSTRDGSGRTGIGDPYLPFRDVPGMQTGVIDDEVAQGVTAEEPAKRPSPFQYLSR